MITSETQPVPIVGAGPTGMTAAMELARFGIPVRLIDKRSEPETTSRAIGVQARTLELFEQRGLADEMLKVSNKGLAASIYGDDKRVFRLEFSHIDSRYGYLCFISQAETERILREQLARQGVRIERSVEMVAFAQSESAIHPGQSGGVAATLHHKDGTLEELQASYLISAEGAHSVVRDTLGLSFEGKSLEENYALGDLYIDGDLAETDFHIFSSEYGLMGLFPMGGRRFRLIASNPISKPSKDTAPEQEELQKIYDMRSHIPAKFRDMSWSSWFRINSRMISKLQEGRVFLGGDAAHIHSPAGAQGMNTGIQDMIDLSWKLAMVMEAKASEKLLSSYGEDRIPVIRDLLTKTEGLTEVIGAERPLFRILFNHVAPLLVGTEFVQEKSTTRMSQIGLHYRDSSLSETYEHQGSLRAGDRVPDMAVKVMNKEGSAEQNPRLVRLFSLFNPSRFTLLYVNIDHPAALHAEIESSIRAWHGFIDGHQIAPPERLSDSRHFKENFGHAASLVLVRPDSYIGFTSRAPSVSQLVAYLKKWFKSDDETASENN